MAMTAAQNSPAEQYRAATTGAALFDLSRRGKIELAGRDARFFLHNLCTQDVKTLPVGAGCEAFLTTNKARVIAHVWVGHHQTDAGGVLWLDMAQGQQEKVMLHLQHYLISEQVELCDRTQELAMLRVIGPRAPELLSGVIGQPAALPELHHRVVPGVGLVRRQSLLALTGFDVFCPVADAASLATRLVGAGALWADADTYQVLRIEAGLPEVGSDIDESRFAVETGRAAQAISYTKGCYLGQETIVMARDRGQVNRLLMGVKTSGAEVIPPGARLFREGNEVGQVTSSTFSPRVGQAIALAYLRRGCWDAGTELAIADGRSAVVCSLPFVAGA